MVDKGELLAEMENTDVVHCTLSDGYSLDIGTSAYWVGGSENGYMCDLLGNVEYSTKEGVVNALYAYLDTINASIEEID